MSKKTNVRKTRFPWLFLGGLFLFCLWLTYLYGVFYIPSLPKAEIPPFLQTQTAADVPSAAATESAEQTADHTPPSSVQTVQPPQTSDSVQDPEPTNLYTRRAGVYNILCAGRDEAAYNTDVLMLVSFDTVNGAVSVVQIPRDTYFDGSKINALWAKKRKEADKKGSQSVDADAMEALCTSLEETLCIQIDHWVLCSLTAFREAVDAIGGVTVDVPYDMNYDDPAQNLSIHLTAGEQRLDGTQAEGLIRFRSDYIRGDLGRVDMQKLFLTALLKQGKEVSLLQLPALLKTAIRHLSTGMSFSDLLFFAKEAQKLDLSRVTFLTLPGTDCREYGDSGAWYYVLSRQGTLETVNAHLNVYHAAVADALFDADHHLTDAAKSQLYSYYQAYLAPAASTAAAIAENGVDVARYAQ